MKIRATDAVFEGFRITREKPVLLLWLGLIYLVGSMLVIGLAYQPFMSLLGFMESFQVGSEPSQQEMEQLFTIYGQILGVALPVSFVTMSLVMPAIVRAVLTPEDKRFGYLRLGRVEVITLATVILMSLGWFAVVMLAGGLAAAIMAANPALGVLVGLLVGLGLMVAGVWLVIRLSLVIPVTVMEKRFGFADSLRLTKGNYWALLGMGFIAVILSFGVSILVNIVAMPFGLMSGGGYGLLTGQGVTVLTVIGFIGTTVLSAMMSAAQSLIMMAPFASAYRMLRNG